MESPRAEMRAPAPRPQLARSGRVFITRDWYDDRAPRTLALTDDALTVLTIVAGVLLVITLIAFYFLGFVAFFVGGFFIVQKGTRTALRRGATGWLDGLPPG